MASLKIPEEEPRLAGILRCVSTGETLIDVPSRKLNMRLRMKNSPNVHYLLAY